MTGSVVQVTAGKEKGKYFLVMREENRRVWIADGRRVKVQKPKQKNTKHIALIAKGNLPDPCTNRAVTAFLKPYTQMYYKEELTPCPKRI